MRVLVTLLALSAIWGLTGCESGSADVLMPQRSSDVPAQDDESEIQVALAKLTPENRKLAEVQRWCAVQTEDRLGSMGVPTKIMVDGQPVFLCCKGCQKRALAEPEKTLATIKELKQKQKVTGSSGS